MPFVTVKTLAAPINYLDPTSDLPVVEQNYRASRVSFGGATFRTWMLHGDDEAQHAVAAVLLLISSDPARVKQVLEIQ